MPVLSCPQPCSLVTPAFQCHLTGIYGRRAEGERVCQRMQAHRLLSRAQGSCLSVSCWGSLWDLASQNPGTALGIACQEWSQMLHFILLRLYLLLSAAHVSGSATYPLKSLLLSRCPVSQRGHFLPLLDRCFLPHFPRSPSYSAFILSFTIVCASPSPRPGHKLHESGAFHLCAHLLRISWGCCAVLDAE